jgi:hypothetical protein
VFYNNLDKEEKTTNSSRDMAHYMKTELAIRNYWSPVTQNVALSVYYSACCSYSFI